MKNVIGWLTSLVLALAAASACTTQEVEEKVETLAYPCKIAENLSIDMQSEDCADLRAHIAGLTFEISDRKTKLKLEKQKTATAESALKEAQRQYRDALLSVTDLYRKVSHAIERLNDDADPVAILNQLTDRAGDKRWDKKKAVSFVRTVDENSARRALVNVRDLLCSQGILDLRINGQAMIGAEEIGRLQCGRTMNIPPLRDCKVRMVEPH